MSNDNLKKKIEELKKSAEEIKAQATSGELTSDEMREIAGGAASDLEQSVEDTSCSGTFTCTVHW